MRGLGFIFLFYTMYFISSGKLFVKKGQSFIQHLPGTEDDQSIRVAYNNLWESLELLNRKVK